MDKTVSEFFAASAPADPQKFARNLEKFRQTIEPTPRRDLMGPAPEVVLSDEQQAASDEVVERIRAGVSRVALLGPAGSGKTTVMVDIESRLNAHVGTPTNRAANAARARGSKDAKTIHKLSKARPITPQTWINLGDLLQRAQSRDITYVPDPQRPIPTRVSPKLMQRALDTAYANRDAYFGLRLLEENGRTQDLEWSKSKRSNKVLLVDEASMVGNAFTRENLAPAFPQIVYVGDPNQLPPVNDESGSVIDSLDEDECIRLKTIHRQAENNPIIQLAHRIIHGDIPDPLDFPDTGSIRQAGVLDNHAHSPVLAYRNQKCSEFNRAIRRFLDLPSDEVVPGEPVILNKGFYNSLPDAFVTNAIFTFKGREGLKTQLVDEFGETHEISDMWVEGVHPNHLKGRNELTQPVFKPAYCMTVHKAQGSEWDQVGISIRDWNWSGRTTKVSAEERRRWCYTAVTRAKREIVFIDL